MSQRGPHSFLPVSTCISCFFPLDLVSASQWWVLGVFGFPSKGAQYVEVPEGPGRTTHLEAAGHQVATSTFQLWAVLFPLRAESHLQLFLGIHMKN